jgi:H+/Cl- antiporter ClcA
MQWPRPRLPYVQKRHRVSLFSSRQWFRHMLFWGGAVGVGLAATAFALSSDQAQRLFRHVVAISPWLPLLLTPLTLAGVAALTQRYFKGAEGSGIPQTIAAIHMPEGSRRDAVLSLRVAVGKMLLTCVGLAGGASVGREGPTVQIGAALQPALADPFSAPSHGARTDHRRRRCRGGGGIQHAAGRDRVRHRGNGTLLRGTLERHPAHRGHHRRPGRYLRAGRLHLLRHHRRRT